MRQLLDLAESGVDKDRDRVVDAFLTLRTRAGVTSLPELLKNPHLRPAQKAELIKSFGNYLFDPPLTADPLIEVLLSQTGAPTLVKMAGLETLALFGPVQGERIAALLIAWSKDSDPDMRLTALATIEKTRLAQAVPELVKRLTDDTFTAFERRRGQDAARVRRAVIRRAADEGSASAGQVGRRADAAFGGISHAGAG